MGVRLDTHFLRLTLLVLGVDMPSVNFEDQSRVFVTLPSCDQARIDSMFQGMNDKASAQRPRFINREVQALTGG